MNNTPIKLSALSAELFRQIYTDVRLCKAVAYAHQCLDAASRPLYKKALFYPHSYIVTEEQIEKAKTELARAKAQSIEENRGKLVFVGMGSAYKARYDDDVCNHRVRAEFFNRDGRKFFIEFCRGLSEKSFVISHAIDRDLEESWDRKISHLQPYNNYKGLEKGIKYNYTCQNLLAIVNQHFECDYQEIIIDSDLLHPDPDDFINEHPNPILITA